MNWKAFSLEQVNSREGPDWRLWEQPEDYPSRGLLAFRAGKAAQSQGAGLFDRFHFALLRARHEQGKDVSVRDNVLQVARDAGLDLPSFERGLADRSLLAKIGEEHTEGAKLGVFGTPTLVFQNEKAAYLKLRPTPPPEDALDVFQELHAIIVGRPYVLEIKRPK